ncbi:MAG: hypothetical protein AAGH15_14405 [Myxococcota bacterium]
MRLWASLLLPAACQLAACHGTRPAPPAPPLAELEASFLAPGPLEVRFRAEAEGALSARIDGVLLLDGEARSRLRFRGTLAGEPVDVLRVCDGSRCGGRVGDTVQEPTAQPPGTREAWVLGLTRMGILHNVAVATGGGAPDHAGEDVRAWIRPEDVVGGEGSLAFDVVVDGERAARARLFFDRANRPIRREQTVFFAEGAMRVVETYASFALGGAAPADASFALPSEELEAHTELELDSRDSVILADP